MGAPPHWMGTWRSTTSAAVAEVRPRRQRVRAADRHPERGTLQRRDRDPQGASLAVFKPQEAMAPHDTTKPGEISWNELITTDCEAGFKFYSELFGWKQTDEMDMGPAGKYKMYGQGDKMYGGMMNKTPDMPMPPAWIYYINVDDVEGAIARATSKGGKKVFGPQGVPAAPRVAQLIDPQGRYSPCGPGKSSRYQVGARSKATARSGCAERGFFAALVGQQEVGTGAEAQRTDHEANGADRTERAPSIVGVLAFRGTALQLVIAFFVGDRFLLQRHQAGDPAHCDARDADTAEHVRQGAVRRRAAGSCRVEVASASFGPGATSTLRRSPSPARARSDARKPGALTTISCLPDQRISTPSVAFASSIRPTATVSVGAPGAARSSRAECAGQASTRCGDLRAFVARGKLARDHSEQIQAVAGRRASPRRRRVQLGPRLRIGVISRNCSHARALVSLSKGIASRAKQGFGARNRFLCCRARRNEHADGQQAQSKAVSGHFPRLSHGSTLVEVGFVAGCLIDGCLVVVLIGLGGVFGRIEATGFGAVGTESPTTEGAISGCGGRGVDAGIGWTHHAPADAATTCGGPSVLVLRAAIRTPINTKMASTNAPDATIAMKSFRGSRLEAREIIDDLGKLRASAGSSTLPGAIVVSLPTIDVPGCAVSRSAFPPAEAVSQSAHCRQLAALWKRSRLS
jgi:predicted enzyme related to lactoylglutathione lyase